jgi:hypothetical protein
MGYSLVRQATLAGIIGFDFFAIPASARKWRFGLSLDLLEDST